MTTDEDRAFEEWWASDDWTPEAYKGSAHDTWHAAVAWATARERERNWQPIATALKVRRPMILIIDSDGEVTVAFYVDEHAEWRDPYKCRKFPTHWMPLPAPLNAVDASKSPDNSRHGDSHIVTGTPENIAAQDIAADPLSNCGHPEPPTACMNWAGWDASNLPWSAAHHQDRVCRAVFGEAWSMGQASKLISFIERTWGTPNRSEPPADHIPDAKKMVGTTTQPEPPADNQVERARHWMQRHGPRWKHDVYQLMAAFAAEYAAEVTGDMASRFADDAAHWKDRAEAAEKALAEEREACAKVADAYRVYWSYTNSFAGHSAGARIIAAAIRASKGDSPPSITSDKEG